MGNVTSDLIETAVQSANSERETCSVDDHTTESSQSKRELYRLLRERMADGSDKDLKHTAATADNPTDAEHASPAMMAPKKKFLFGYRGKDDEKTTANTDAAMTGGVVSDVAMATAATAKVAQVSMSAEVARSRSHTVSLPFRSRGPPQPEAPRRPLIEPHKTPADGVSSAAVDSMGVISESLVGTVPASGFAAANSGNQPVVAHVKSPPKAHPVTVELAARGCDDVRPVAGVTHHQWSSPSPRAVQQYHHDPTGMNAPSGSSRLVVHHAQDRSAAHAEPASRHAALPACEPFPTNTRHDVPTMVRAGIEHPVDRRFLVPSGTDLNVSAPEPEHRRQPHPAVMHHVEPSFALDRRPYMTADDRRKVGGHQVMEHADARASMANNSYASHVPPQASHYVDPRNMVARYVDTQNNVRTDTRQLDQDQSGGAYPSRSSELPRGWVADSYRHSGGGCVELAARHGGNVEPAVRERGPGYTSDVMQHLQPKHRGPTHPRVMTSDYSNVPYQMREAMIVDAETEHRRRQLSTHHQLQPPDHPRHHSPLHPVEPSVRPRIAGLTHADPATYEPQAGYHTEHMYSSSRYDPGERQRPSSNVLAVADHKQARRHSPYPLPPGSTRSSSRASGAGSVGGFSRGDFVAHVTPESPLDLTVKKEQCMTAEAFLRRCQDSSQVSNQFVRHGAELQYSGFPSRHWTAAGSDAAESVVDVRHRMSGTAGMILPPESSAYAGYIPHRSGDTSRPVYAYQPHFDTYSHRSQPAYPPQHHSDDVAMLYDQKGVSATTQHTYCDRSLASRSIAEPTHRSVDSQVHRNAVSYGGDVAWHSKGPQFGVARLMKSGDEEPLMVDRLLPHGQSEIPASSSPASLSGFGRRVPMVQLLGGKYSPSDILHLCCKVCGSTYGSLRSFRMHFAKAHGHEPTPENFTIQTISDARIQAMSARAQEATADVGSMAGVHSESAEPTTVDKRSVGEFAVATKQRSVAEVQPIQKKTSPVVVPDRGPPTPGEATKRCSDDRRLKCKKCGLFTTRDLSELRHHLSGHGSASELQSGGAVCLCQPGADVVDSDTGCAVCLEGFNDVSDWQVHVTSQHMMRSCICRTCDLGFTNASALCCHLTATHGVDSPTGTGIQVEYRCLFCPEAFTDELSLYTHTRAHEQHYSSQRASNCSLAPRAGHATLTPRLSVQTRVQTAVPDTTCPEDQRLSAAELTSLESAPTAVESSQTQQRSRELDKPNTEITVGDVGTQKPMASEDVRLKSKKASILRRLSAGKCY